MKTPPPLWKLTETKLKNNPKNQGKITLTYCSKFIVWVNFLDCKCLENHL